MSKIISFALESLEFSIVITYREYVQSHLGAQVETIFHIRTQKSFSFSWFK